MKQKVHLHHNQRVSVEHLKIEMALALKTEAYAPNEVCHHKA